VTVRAQGRGLATSTQRNRVNYLIGKLYELQILQAVRVEMSWMIPDDSSAMGGVSPFHGTRAPRIRKSIWHMPDDEGWFPNFLEINLSPLAKSPRMIVEFKIHYVPGRTLIAP
jgi:hypothetical protein